MPKNWLTKLLRATTLLITLGTAALVCFPPCNNILHIVSATPPEGMIKSDVPKLSLKGFLTGSFQIEMSRILLEHSGLWRPLTMLQNQIIYSLFSQIGPFHDKSFILGRDGQLIQSRYLPALTRDSPKLWAKTLSRLGKLKELQERQGARGKALVLLLSPDTVTLYPELVPARYQIRGQNLERRASRLREAITKLGIVCVDAVQSIRRISQAAPPTGGPTQRIIGRGASHANDRGSCEILKNISDMLRTLPGRTLRNFSCDRWHFEYPPREKDSNLIDLANLFDKTPFLEPMPYVDVQFLEETPATKPSVLLVGSSHLSALFGHLKEWQLTSRTSYLFYFIESRGEDTKFGLKELKVLPWKDYLDSDITIVDLLTRSPDRVGNGFIEGALKYLRSH